MAKTGKRLRKARESVDPDQVYSIEDAVKLVKTNGTVKFDETVEIAMNLGVDTRHADQQVRGVVQLPHGTGKSVRVAVFAKDAKAEEAKAAGADIVGAEDLAEQVPGADIVGAEDLAEQVQAGKIEFERVVATPDMMAIVGRLGKILGPRGLMPNPKLGSVTPNVAEAVKAAKGGEIEFRAQKEGIVHAGIGKTSFSEEALTENTRAFVSAISRAKPSGSKGTFIKRVSISSTMGPGVKLDVAGATSAD